MKARSTLALAAAGLAMAGAAALPLAPGLVWNRTQSVPPGLYHVSGGHRLERGDMVAYQPAASESDWLEAQGYIGAGWPLLKRVAALEGDEVCRTGAVIFINASPAAYARAEDAAGRGLPDWEGCRILEPEDVFLLADHPRSVDGRYFGVQDRRRILGKANLVWPARSGHLKRIWSERTGTDLAPRYSVD